MTQKKYASVEASDVSSCTTAHSMLLIWVPINFRNTILLESLGINICRSETIKIILKIASTHTLKVCIVYITEKKVT